MPFVSTSCANVVVTFNTIVACHFQLTATNWAFAKKLSYSPKQSHSLIVLLSYNSILSLLDQLPIQECSLMNLFASLLGMASILSLQ